MEENQNMVQNKTSQPESTVEKSQSFSLLDCVYAYFMLLIGYCFMRFAAWNVTGMFTTLFFAGTAFACLYYLKKNNCRLYTNHKIIFGLILLFSTVFSITANSFIKFINVLFLLITGIYWVYSVCRENKELERFFLFDLCKALFIIPFLSFGKASKAIVYWAGRSKSGNNVKLVILGLVVTIPVTLMVAMLLIRADSGIEAILNVLFGSIFEHGMVSIVQFCFGIPVAFYLFGMLYANVNKINTNTHSEEEYEKKLEGVKIFPNLVMYSAVTPVCILYVLFFVMQLRYFISAFAGVLPEAYSYAEYARRGFFELTAIAIINLMITLFINFFSKQSGNNKTALLKAYSILISVFTVLLIATALSKMIMYINNYGLTQLRVYTSWFMVLLAIVNVLVIIKQVNIKFNFIKYTAMAFVLLFGFLCFSNVDGNIAKYNIKMYQAGYLKELDIDALCNLSDDALVYVLKEKLDTKDYLDVKLETYHSYPYLTYNLSSFRVKRLLEGR